MTRRPARRRGRRFRRCSFRALSGKAKPRPTRRGLRVASSRPTKKLPYEKDVKRTPPPPGALPRWTHPNTPLRTGFQIRLSRRRGCRARALRQRNPTRTRLHLTAVPRPTTRSGRRTAPGPPTPRSNSRRSGRLGRAALLPCRRLSLTDKRGDCSLIGGIDPFQTIDSIESAICREDGVDSTVDR